MERRTFIKGLGAAVVLAPGVTLGATRRAHASVNAHLKKVNPAFLVTPQEAHAWHVAKDSMGGPTIAGSPSWKNFLEICEKELKSCGVVDVFRNPWTYTRWSTAEWPDDSKWSLQVGGEKVKIASYGCNSGATPEAGVTGGLVVYKDGMSADELEGKIAIIVKPQAAALLLPADGPSFGYLDFRSSDYEFLSNPETFADPLQPQDETLSVSPFRQMGLADAQKVLIDSGAVGAVIVLGLSYEAAAGTYTFGVPALHQMPTLYADYETGKELVEAARAGKEATLRLIAETEESETYQLFGYLPGKNYGTDADEQILLITHTDGPSISQDNGAFGILGMVKYFNYIPQAERPRTLMVFLDCRHYMPGAERAFAQQDYSAKHPERYIYKKVVAAMGIEHLGQMQVAEGDGKPYHKTGLPEVSTLWITHNQQLVDWAIQAVKDNGLERVQIQCPGRPGVKKGEQGPWYGLGGIATRLKIPGASTMGSMSAYWSSKARIDYFDAEHFVDQVATMSQICGELMLADMKKIETLPGYEAPQRRPSETS